MTTLDQLNSALKPHGWFAEWVSGDDTDFRVMLGRPQGGQLHDRFEFDPSDSADNAPWEHRTFPADDSGIDRALLALCEEAQS